MKTTVPPYLLFEFDLTRKDLRQLMLARASQRWLSVGRVIAAALVAVALFFLFNSGLSWGVAILFALTIRADEFGLSILLRRLRYAIAIGLVLVATYYFVTDGPGWNIALLLLIAFLIGMDLVDGTFAICRLRGHWPLTTRVTINDVGVAIETKTSEAKELLWSSLARDGSATEFEHHYWLQCSRGAIWIPKRAISNEDELTNFRTLVAEKMGDRCAFGKVPNG